MRDSISINKVNKNINKNKQSEIDLLKQFLEEKDNIIKQILDKKNNFVEKSVKDVLFNFNYGVPLT